MPVPLVDFPPTTRLFLWMLVFAMIVTQSVISVGDFIRCERTLKCRSATVRHWSWLRGGRA